MDWQIGGKPVPLSEHRQSSRRYLRDYLRDYLLWAACALFLLLSLDAWAQDPTDEEFAALESRIDSLPTLSDAQRTQLSDSLQQARRQMLGLQERRQQIRNYQTIAQDYETRSTQLQQQIQSQIGDGEESVEELPSTESELQSVTTELEARIRQLSQDLFESREIESSLSRRSAQIASEMSQAAEQINAVAETRIKSDLAQTQPLDRETVAVFSDVQTFVESLRSHIALESIQLFQVELNTLAPRQTLSSLQSRLLETQLDTMLEGFDRHWQALSELRLQQARDFLDSLTDVTTGRPLADTRVMNLLESRQGLLEQELPLVRRISQVSRSLLDIYQIRLLLARVTTTGAITDELSATVRELREELPEREALDSELSQLQERIQELRVQQIVWESELRDNRNRDDFVTVTPQVSNETGLDQLLQEQTSLLTVANRLVDRMITLEAALIEVRSRTSQVQSTFDGSVLWLRTNDVIGLSWVRYGYQSIRWLLDPDTWRGVEVPVREAIERKSFLLSLFIAGIAGLLALRPRLKRSLNHDAQRVGNVGVDDYWNTPQAVFYTLLLALPLPMLFLLAAWTIGDVFVFSGSILPALTSALLAAGISLLLVLFCKTLCRPDGVFLAHFGWPEKPVIRFRRHLVWFNVVLAVCTAAYAFAITSGRTDLRYSLGMTSLLLASVAISALLNVMFHPSRGVVYEREHPKERSSLTRLTLICLILLPMLIGLLPLSGYFDTASAIQERLFETLLLLLAVVVVVGVLLREFFVAHRRMALRKARARRSALEAERSLQESTPASGDATPDLTLEWDADYSRASEEARQLFNLAGVLLFLIGVWTVWNPMFPILDNLNDVVMWQSVASVEGSPVTEPVTLGKLLFALAILMLGIIGSRNLRSILELLFFERLKMDTGTRYAVNAIASYTLLGGTLLYAIAQLGVDWSRLQWIVAALGVGLGFGLQEIVANFISGLIILFERPVRVGDTVTIGGVSGTVSNIQIRATTVTDFENREVVLPNKSIITEEVTNWTRHDAVTRVLLVFNVALDSDIDQVRQLMEQCVQATDDVLDFPEPTVFLVNHAEYALQFEIRVFVATPAYRLPVAHELNASINRKLKEHEVQIPYPQRVVHLKGDGFPEGLAERLAERLGTVTGGQAEPPQS